MRRFILVSLILLVAGGAVVVWQWQALLGWYYFRQLSQAAENDRARWIQRLVALDAAVLPGAMRCLAESDAAACCAAETVLIGLVGKWGIGDERALGVLRELKGNWAALSWPGKGSTLNLARVPLEVGGGRADGGAWADLANDLLHAGAGDFPLQRAALKLADVLGGGFPGKITGEVIVPLARQGLRSDDSATRVLALRLFLQPPFTSDAELLDSIRAFLRDPSGPVRRSALLVLGADAEVLACDDMLLFLHDADADVRKLCETLLRSRGLSDQHLQLARLISDERPRARLEVLPLLDQIRDLEPGVWLRRLCQDPEPAVRAAAVRAAAQQTRVDLNDCLHDLAVNDPSGTVRQIVRAWQVRSGGRQD
jgi:hypothetical protein